MHKIPEFGAPRAESGLTCALPENSHSTHPLSWKKSVKNEMFPRMVWSSKCLSPVLSGHYVQMVTKRWYKVWKSKPKYIDSKYNLFLKRKTSDFEERIKVCIVIRDVTGLNFTGFPDPDFYLILKFRIPEPDSRFLGVETIFDNLCNSVVFCFFFSRPFMKISNFSKSVHTIWTKFSTVIFYTIIWSYVWNFNKFVWLGLERVRWKKT